jgi:hypothetical protein
MLVIFNNKKLNMMLTIYKLEMKMQIHVNLTSMDVWCMIT